MNNSNIMYSFDLLIFLKEVIYIQYWVFNLIVSEVVFRKQIKWSCFIKGDQLYLIYIFGDGDINVWL